MEDVKGSDCAHCDLKSIRYIHCWSQSGTYTAGAKVKYLAQERNLEECMAEHPPCIFLSMTPPDRRHTPASVVFLPICFEPRPPLKQITVDPLRSVGISSHQTTMPCDLACHHCSRASVAYTCKVAFSGSETEYHVVINDHVIASSCRVVAISDQLTPFLLC
jgi:hypothetical protein